MAVLLDFIRKLLLELDSRVVVVHQVRAESRRIFAVRISRTPIAVVPGLHRSSGIADEKKNANVHVVVGQERLGQPQPQADSLHALEGEEAAHLGQELLVPAESLVELKTPTPERKVVGEQVAVVDAVAGVITWNDTRKSY